MSSADAEGFIARLQLGLRSADRQAFTEAAEAALAAAPPALRGPGADFRVIERVWRTYFVPPVNGATSWDSGSIARRRRTKLLDADEEL
jgi:hypothetical protein